MEEVKIESEINQDEYIRLLFLITYRKPPVIIISLLGIIMTLVPVLYFLKIYTAIDSPPFIPLTSGVLITVVFPLSIYLMARRNFRIDELLRQPIRYTFTMDKIFLKGLTFDVTIGWDKIHKVKRLNKWLLLYRDRARVEFMIKNTFNDHEQNEFDRIVKLKAKA
jgi:hypothetical protein